MPIRVRSAKEHYQKLRNFVSKMRYIMSPVFGSHIHREDSVHSCVRATRPTPEDTVWHTAKGPEVYAGA